VVNPLNVPGTTRTPRAILQPRTFHSFAPDEIEYQPNERHLESSRNTLCNVGPVGQPPRDGDLGGPVSYVASSTRHPPNPIHDRPGWSTTYTTRPQPPQKDLLTCPTSTNVGFGGNGCSKGPVSAMGLSRCPPIWNPVIGKTPDPGTAAIFRMFWGCAAVGKTG